MTSKSAIQSLATVVLAALLAASPGAQGREECDWGCPNDGLEYRDALAAAIGRADRIVVTEHSSPWDGLNKESRATLAERELVYETVELSKAQREAFQRTIQKLDPKTDNGESACIPLWHHTVRFYENGHLASTMKICFVCGHLDWDGIKVTRPRAIFDGLREVISDLGLHPKREWHVLAYERLKSAL